MSRRSAHCSEDEACDWNEAAARRATSRDHPASVVCCNRAVEETAAGLSERALRHSRLERERRSRCPLVPPNRPADRLDALQTPDDFRMLFANDWLPEVNVDIVFFTAVLAPHTALDAINLQVAEKRDEVFRQVVPFRPAEVARDGRVVAPSLLLGQCCALMIPASAHANEERTRLPAWQVSLDRYRRSW